MEKDCVRIEDSLSLIRDIDNRAVINTNKDERAKILAARAKRIQDAQELEMLKKDVNDIKDAMSKILTLLERTQ